MGHSKRISLSKNKKSFEGNLIEYLQKNDSWIKTAIFIRWLLADEGMTAIVPAFLWIVGGTGGILLLTNLALNELLNGCIKWICQRPRPFWTNSKIKNIGGLWEEDFGFPSSHAQISACFFSCILFQYGLIDHLYENVNLIYPLLFVLLLLLVFIAGMTRIYLGVHYPSDVIVGWIIGVCTPLIFRSLHLFDWFRQVGSPNHLYLSMFVPFLIYFCFATIRFIVRQPSLISTWEKTAHYNELVLSSKTIQPLRLSKYTIQIWSLTGGLVGASMALDDQRFHFIYEIDHWQEILSFSLLRTLLGYSILLFLLFPLTFVVPMMFNRQRIFSFLLKCLGAFLIGWWAFYGCPKLADIMFSSSLSLSSQTEIHQLNQIEEVFI